MKTDKSKKLVLDRETLVPLQPEQLDSVNGGLSIISGSCCRNNSCNTRKGVEV